MITPVLFIYKPKNIHTYMYAYTQTVMYIQLVKHTHKQYVCTSTHEYILKQCVDTSMHAHPRTQAHIRPRMHAHIYTYAHIHARTHENPKRNIATPQHLYNRLYQCLIGCLTVIVCLHITMLV